MNPNAPHHKAGLRPLLLAAVTMLFFAANSLLTRLALRGGGIDAGSFAAFRILAGAAALALASRSGGQRPGGSWRASGALFLYVAGFSFAYLSLSAGTGALLLFAAVQITMLAAGRERPRPAEWMGLLMALGGLAYLVFPGLTAPPAAGVALMTAAGAAWGYYTVAAKGSGAPLAATAGNFARAVPAALLLAAVVWVTGSARLTWSGIALAVACGAVTSGLGYALWYTALRGLRTSFAAIVQLTVPPLTAAAGVLLLGEPVTWRVALASAAILGGVALASRAYTRCDAFVSAGCADAVRSVDGRAAEGGGSIG